jgi:putative oxidoreductase
MSNPRNNNQIIDRLLSTNDSVAALILRVPIGLFFVAHGAQKLFGWFGGYGPAGTGQFFDSVGLQPGLVLALLAGAVEFFGGLALVAGLLVRPAAAALAVAMVVAVFAVHWDKGFFVTAGGYEYALTLVVASLSLFVSGGGRHSLDGWLRGRGRVAAPSRSGVPNLGTSH